MPPSSATNAACAAFKTERIASRASSQELLGQSHQVSNGLRRRLKCSSVKISLKSARWGLRAPNSAAWPLVHNSRRGTIPADNGVSKMFFLFVKPVTCRTRIKEAFALQFSKVPLTLLSSFEVAKNWSKSLVHSDDHSD